MSIRITDLPVCETDLQPIQVIVRPQRPRRTVLDLIGPNEPVDYFSADPDRSIRPEARNKLRDELRAKIEEWVHTE